MIRVENLVKRYGDLLAVDHVGFEVAPGEIYGLLGPNGAGKTTTLSMMAGLLTPDAGTIHYGELDMGRHPRQVKAQLGVVPQETALYDDLSAREHLRLWAGLYGLARRELDEAVDRSLEQVGLSGRADEASKRFSGGMKRRLNLALGLVHQPKAVLLDEPTVGIDPQARLKILEVVRRVADEGTAVLYTTHYLEEAEGLCDRIAVVDHGRMLAEGTLEELQQRVGGRELVTLRGAFADGVLADQLADQGARVLVRDEHRLVVSTQGGEGERGSVSLLSRLFADKVALDGVTIEPPSLNSLFLELTGRELRD